MIIPLHQFTGDHPAMPSLTQTNLDLIADYCRHGLEFGDRGWLSDADRILATLAQDVHVLRLRQIIQASAHEVSPTVVYKDMLSAIGEIRFSPVSGERR